MMWWLFDLFCLICMLYAFGAILELIGNLWLIGFDAWRRLKYEEAIKGRRTASP